MNEAGRKHSSHTDLFIDTLVIWRMDGPLILHQQTNYKTREYDSCFESTLTSLATE